MADNVTDLEKLYTPAASPFEDAVASGVQSTFNTGRFKPETKAMVQSLSGTNQEAELPTMPIGNGNQMYSGPMFSQSDIGNVAGLLKKPEEKKAFIPSTPINTLNKESIKKMEKDMTFWQKITQ